MRDRLATDKFTWALRDTPELLEVNNLAKWLKAVNHKYYKNDRNE